MSDATPSGISDADWIGHDDGPEIRWQPISTAPKDGTHVLLWRGRALLVSKLVIGYWRQNQGWHTSLGHWRFSEAIVTHWMPCPKGPE